MDGLGRELPISSLRDSLTDVVGNLNSVIEDLRNRLTPYMAPDYSEKAPGSDEVGPLPSKSSIVLYFEDKISTVKSITGNISEILGRLDI